MAAILNRGTNFLFIATAVAQLSALLRYTLLARFLGPEQLGMAAILVLTGQFFDSISDSGSDRFLVQDKSGNEPEVQNLVQLVYITRGIFAAVCLVVFSGLLADLYHMKSLAVGLMLMGIPPLISGFLHLDLRRVQRTHDFRPEAWGMLVSELLSLVCTLIAAELTHSYLAILLGLAVKMLALVVVSHILSERTYRIGFSQKHAKRLTLFAYPLMLNGLLLFLGSQGDRLLVGSSLGITDLGRYSAVMLLIYYPTSLLIRFIGAIHLPKIAASRDTASQLETEMDSVAGNTYLLSTTILLGFVVAAPLGIAILFGPKFSMNPFLISLIAVLQTLRLLRVWPGTAALAGGFSGTVLFCNIVRVLVVLLAFAYRSIIGGLAGILIAFILGEILAMGVSLVLVNRAFGLGNTGSWRRFAGFLGICLATVGITFSIDDHVISIGLCSGAMLLILVTFTCVSERSTIGAGRRLAEAALRTAFSATKLE